MNKISPRKIGSRSTAPIGRVAASALGSGPCTGSPAGSAKLQAGAWHAAEGLHEHRLSKQQSKQAQGWANPGSGNPP